MTAQAATVSVIVAAFQAEATLAAAVRSALQSPVREVLVVDDASTDGTAAVADALAAADGRVRLVRQPTNGGPARARNRALAEATGDWIAILDADDAFLPGRLDRLLAFAAAWDADLVADDLLLCPEGGPAAPMLGPDLLASARTLNAAGFVFGNLPVPGRPRVGLGFLKPLVRREFLRRHALSYPEDLRFAEDFVFLARCLLRGGRFWLHPEPGYRYAVRTDGLTARHGAAELAALLAADDALLAEAQADARADNGAVRALRRHRRSIRDRLAWRRFTDAAKAGRYPVALGVVLGDAGDGLHVAAKGAATLWRKLGPSSGVGRTAAVRDATPG